MGIEFRESSLLVTAKTDAVAKKGMVFNICVGLSGLKKSGAGDNASSTYALFIGDTVVVEDKEPATLLTQLKKRVKHVSVFLKNDSEEEEEEEKDEPDEVLGRGVRGARSAVMDSRTRTEGTNAEEKRAKHQKELAEKINEEARIRMQGKSLGSDEKK